MSQDIDIPTSGEQSVKLSGLLTMFKEHVFKPAIQEIRKAMRQDKKISKQVYVDTIVRNIKGEILFLQRSYQDDFEPGKWAFPGGKAEEFDASLEIGAKRELLEETGLNVDWVRHIETIEKPECIIHYFEVFVIEPSYNKEGFLAAPTAIILDNNEHYRYQWVASDKIKDYDLLLDLSEHIPSLLVKLTPLSFISASLNQEEIIWQQWLQTDNDLEDYFAIITKAFDEDQLTEEQYQSAREKYLEIKKSNAIKMVEEAFDQGYIDEVRYTNLIASSIK